MELEGKDISKGYVTCEERIPSSKRHVQVAVPCCFTKCKNVLVGRDLSDKEMMVAYDLEESVQKTLRRYSRESGEALTRDFVMEAPVKVLYLALGLVIKAVGCDLPKESSQDTVKEPVPTKVRNEPPTTVEKAQPDKLHRQLKDPTSSSTSVSPAVTSTQASDQRSQVATKNDDAPVETTDWDVWTVDNYELPQAMVCVRGTFCHEKHGRLFDALRSLMLRRARRNAFLGLIRYLRQTHGSELVECVVRYRKKRKRGSRARKGKVRPVASASNLLSRDEARLRAFGPSNERTFLVPTWTQRERYRFGARKGASSEVGRHMELYKDVAVGSDALGRLANSSWWGWDHGSTLLFWRWPSRYRKSVRDGTKLFIKREKLPHFFRRQLWPSDPAHRSKMEEKIGKVRQRGYILPGQVNSLTGFFAVPKGDDDIRIVYDATACGLNDALWSPNFALPTIDSVLRNAEPTSWFSDMDLGEMFLNYFLDEEVREFAGVDVREIGGIKWERWERTLMGFRSSPYVCTQTFGWGESVIQGNRKASENPLRWDSVVLNLPGNEDYNPKLPWVYKWDALNKRIASHFACYMDDIRGVGGTERACRQTTRRVASRVNYLGQQDAPRKRRPPSRTPGAWAGAMCLTKDDSVYVTCTQQKWEKAKSIISRWKEAVVTQQSRSVNAAQMEKDVGFLVYLSRTFPAMFPYLKGFYLSLNSWRTGRNDDGWRYSMAEWRAALELDDDVPSYKVQEFAKRTTPTQIHSDRPSLVDVAPRLAQDIQALESLLAAEEPAHRLVRGDKVNSAKFAFGDASGSGFGSSWEVLGTDNQIDRDKVSYRFGTWGEEVRSGSSNLRELKNLTDTLELMGKDGELSGTEVFLFTDNSTAESAFAKGSSSSKPLFELILRLRKLEMESQCRIHISHVAGTRMIAQGSDGLSRGNLAEGVMRGASMRGFAPINKTAFERSPTLKAWLDDWMNNEGELLDATGWFTRGHEFVDEAWERNSEGMPLPCTQPGTFIWAPPPVVGGIAIEELRKSRHKSFESTHVVVIPKLCSTEWRRSLHKAADIVLSLPPGHPAWPEDMHEPLTLAILFPYIRDRPWELRRTPKLLELEDALCKVWKSGQQSEGPILRELWSLQRTVAKMSTGMARQVLYGKRTGFLQDSSPRKRRRC